MSLRRLVVTGQGLYYIATGAWPLISYSSFECVTGPKVDDWLVRTVGALAIAIGCGLLAGSRRRQVSTETFVLASAAAVVFATVDTVYALGGRISKIYLADAIVELLMLPVLVTGILTSRRYSREVTACLS